MTTDTETRLQAIREWIAEEQTDRLFVRSRDHAAWLLAKLEMAREALREAKLDFERLAAGVIHPAGAAKMSAHTIDRFLADDEQGQGKASDLLGKYRDVSRPYCGACEDGWADSAEHTCEQGQESTSKLARPDARSGIAGTEPAAVTTTTPVEVSAPSSQSSGRQQTAGTNPAASEAKLGGAAGGLETSGGMSSSGRTTGTPQLATAELGNVGSTPIEPAPPSSPPCLDWMDGSTHCDLPRGHDGAHSWESPPQSAERVRTAYKLEASSPQSAVLSAEDVSNYRPRERRWDELPPHFERLAYGVLCRLCDSHEALRRERDGLHAQLQDALDVQAVLNKEATQRAEHHEEHHRRLAQAEQILKMLNDVPHFNAEFFVPMVKQAGAYFASAKESGKVGQ